MVAYKTKQTYILLRGKNKVNKYKINKEITYTGNTGFYIKQSFYRADTRTMNVMALFLLFKNLFSTLFRLILYFFRTSQSQP